MHAPKEVQEAKGLHDHADKWPLDEDEHDATQKAYRTAELLFAREEVECLLGADNKGEA
jgi:hypothetical protein